MEVVDEVAETGEVEWVVHRVKGQHFLKSKTVQIGDKILHCRGSNVRHKGNVNAEPQLPRAWTRLLSSHIFLSNLDASKNQINHHLHVHTRMLFDDEPRHFLHLLDRGQFGRNNRINQSDVRLIREFLQNELHSRSNLEIQRFKSLADSANRKTDRNRVESTLFLPELGSTECGIQFFNKHNHRQLIATNYRRIVYGDHGPYIEFTSDDIEWDSFPDTQSKGDSVAYYDEFYSVSPSKGESVKLYSQRKTVHDQPNPPPGKYSVNHNRPKGEGYADYTIGSFYISPDDLHIELNDNEIAPYLYLLTMRNRDRNHIQRRRNQKISRASKQRGYGPNYTQNQRQRQLESVEERDVEPLPKPSDELRAVSVSSEMRSVYDPDKLTIKIMRSPTIKTREGKRVIKACLSGDYIPGLIYIPDFITEDEEIEIKQQLIDNSHLWRLYKSNHATKRRNLHFGYDLDYDSQEMYRVLEPELSEIPKMWKWIAARAQQVIESEFGVKCKEFNQLILNEYAPVESLCPIL